VKTRAALLTGTGEKWAIEEIDLASPGPDEVLVEMKAAGLCHSDEHMVTGDMVTPEPVRLELGLPSQFPLVGGHEGGANFLAYRVANLIGAIPVVTTATEALKPLIVGIGCRRGVSMQQIDTAITEALSAVSRSKIEIREIATIDLKGNEDAIIQWCEQAGVPLRLIPRSLIQERPWVTKSSPLVYSRFGIEGVCEPCALLGSFKGRLILRKITRNGVAVAIAEEVSGI